MAHKPHATIPISEDTLNAIGIHGDHIRGAVHALTVVYDSSVEFPHERDTIRAIYALLTLFEYQAKDIAALTEAALQEQRGCAQ